MSKNILVGCFFLVLLGLAGQAAAAEYTTSLDDQQGVSVTIYNRDLALVKDRRTLKLPEGLNLLAFREVSGRMKPETALLTGAGVSVLEQNFEFDLLTPEALLQKYVGREVTVIKKHPTTGEESRQKAKVLSAQNGVVLQMADYIETGVPGRLVFADVPENLRDRPTLTMLVKSDSGRRQEVELSYLTTGLGWQADYVAELNADDDAINLGGWVTLTNESGAEYRNALLQLVAGEVNQVAPQPDLGQYRAKRMAMSEALDGDMAEEQMFEYHLYSLARPTTIKDNQTKQVSLLQADRISCRKEFILQGDSNYYRYRYGEAEQKKKIGVYVEVVNRKENNLGMPLPKGVVRVYKKDSQERLQFVGEDRIDHTPENEIVRLKLGEAFDLTARSKQLDFKKITGFSAYNYVHESTQQIELKNGKKEAVTIKIVEPIPGDWQMLTESLPHKKVTANSAVWDVEVPGLGKKVLSYSVRVKY